MREKRWWTKSKETCDVATTVSNINHLIENKAWGFSVVFAKGSDL
jgi:hypothetical protein